MQISKLQLVFSFGSRDDNYQFFSKHAKPVFVFRNNDPLYIRYAHYAFIYLNANNLMQYIDVSGCKSKSSF